MEDGTLSAMQLNSRFRQDSLSAIAVIRSRMDAERLPKFTSFQDYRSIYEVYLRLRCLNGPASYDRSPFFAPSFHSRQTRRLVYQIAICYDGCFAFESNFVSNPAAIEAFWLYSVAFSELLAVLEK